MKLDDCIYCKIANKEFPATVIYEDDLTMCFLEKNPVNPGHCIVISKEHYTSATWVEPETLAAMMDTAQKAGRALNRLKQWDGFNIIMQNGECAGQMVRHAHFHVIPRVGTDGFFLNWRKQEPSAELLQEVADELIEKWNKVHSEDED